MLGAYTPGLLGVQRTPCETERDVTFSRSCDQGRITKSYEDNYVLSSQNVCAIQYISYVLDCSRIQMDICAICFCS